MRSSVIGHVSVHEMSGAPGRRAAARGGGGPGLTLGPARRRLRPALLVALASVLCACGAEIRIPALDAGPTDLGGPPEGDAGVDLGEPPDEGLSHDAEPTPDGGPESDAGPAIDWRDRLRCTDQGLTPAAGAAFFDTAWSQPAPEQSFSSPAAADLDGDGVLDVVVGHGTNSYRTGYVAAYRGADGALLWRTIGPDEMIGSPTFFEADGDGVPDVVIGGRDGALMAVSGVDGSPLWVFDSYARDLTWFSFYVVQRLSDLNDDGVVELLAAAGGDGSKSPTEPRDPGRLVVLDGRSGLALYVAEFADGAETYANPLVVDRPESASGVELVFATGGETFTGGVYAAPLSALLAEDLSSARPLVAPTGTVGVIATPALGNLTGDATPEVVVATMDGRLLARDFVSGAEVFSYGSAMDGAYASVALGHIDRDGVPDAVALFTGGRYPNLMGARIVVVSGASGTLLLEQIIDDRIATPSPVIFDADGDQYEDIVLHLIDAEAESVRIVLYDGRRRTAVELRDDTEAVAWGTPLVVDLDCDGELDLVRTLTRSQQRMSAVQRLRLPGALTSHARSWPGYLGPDGRGALQ